MDSKVLEFKTFVKNNPFLIRYIRNGEKSWQDFYEIYDLYGEDEEAWGKFLESDKDESRSSSESKSSSGYFDELIKVAKNIDVNKVQEGITSLQKTLGLFGDLFASKGNTTKEYSPRPLYRRFED